jgi:hypothetical protein
LRLISDILAERVKAALPLRTGRMPQRRQRKERPPRGLANCDVRSRDGATRERTWRGIRNDDSDYHAAGTPEIGAVDRSTRALTYHIRRVGCMPAKALICGGKCILRSDKSLMNSEFTVGISLSLTSRLCFFASSHCGTIKNRVGVTRVVVEVTKRLRAANSNPVTRPTMCAS